MDAVTLMCARLKFPQISYRKWSACLVSAHPQLFRITFSADGSRSRCIHTTERTLIRKDALKFILRPRPIQNHQSRNTMSMTHPYAILCVRNSVLLQGSNIRNIQTDSRQDGSSTGPTGIPLWKRALFVTTVGGLMGYCFWSVNKQKEISEEKVRYDEFKRAQIGGDWVLTDQTGKKRSSTEFRGQWILMYFGFTHCPDICPEELEKLIRIVKTFDADPKLPNMLPIFISLDPDRDTPAVVRDYLADLKYPRMLGFTGTEEEITEVAKKFRAYFKKGPPDEDNDYIVDHTIIIYLVSPKGEFVNYYDRSRTAERIVASVTEHIDKYNSLEKSVKTI